MSARSVTNALLAVARAAHAAYVNADAPASFSTRRAFRPVDYDALGRALYALDMATGRKGGDRAGPELAEALLASQVHPDSALPSRPDYSAGFDTTAAQYGALAFHGGVTRTVRDVKPTLMRQAVASIVSRSGDDLRIGWLRPERCDVGTLLYCATEGESDDGR